MKCLLKRLRLVNKVILWLWIIIFLQSPGACADQLEEFFQSGKEAYQKGDYQRAVEWFEKVIDLDPNFALVYNDLGKTYQALNAKISDIEWFFKVAIDIDPQFIEAYDNLCKAYYQAGQYDKAEQSCLKALALNPSLGSAQFTLGWTYLLGKGQPDEAIYYFEEVLKKVKIPIIYFGLGMAYSTKGDNAQVLEMITTLRNLGEDEKATQLENAIRRQTLPPPPAEIVNLEDKQKGTLIEANPKEPVADGSEPSEVRGFTRVRLRGKFTNIEQPPGTQPPSSGSGASTSDAIQRVREMQRRRLGLPQGY